MQVISTYVPSTISRFLKHIREANTPPKVTNAYLKSVGFRSSNDSALITIFKALGFLDQTGTPTELWRNYRGDKNAAAVLLAGAVRQAYSGLFEMFPDAQRKDDEAVGNWIRGNSNVSNEVVIRAIRTFKVLCSEADFSGSATQPAGVPVATTNPVASGVAQPLSSPSVTLPAGPHVNINIELQIQATDNMEIYDNFFAAMKKNLFDES